jgi:ribosomal protein S15P/S13E
MGNEAIAAVSAVIKKAGGRKKGKKGRKIGRYSKHPSSMRYKGEKRWLVNKAKRIRRHLKNHPDDAQARGALEVAKAA